VNALRVTLPALVLLCASLAESGSPPSSAASSSESIGRRIENAAALERKGDFAAARAALDGIVRDAHERHGAASVEVADAAQKRGWVLYRLGEYRAAVADLNRALAICRAQSDALRTARALSSLGVVRRDLDDYVQAERDFAEALRLARTGDTRAHLDMQAVIHNDFAGLRFYQGDLVAAIAEYERGGELFRGLHGEHSVELAQIYNNLGLMHHQLGRYDEAQRWFGRSLPLKETLYGPRHATTASTVTNLGDVAFALGRYEAARAFYARALATFEESLGPEHPNVAIVETSLAEVDLAQSSPDAALERLRHALRIREASIGAASSWVAEALLPQARAMQALSRPHDARESAERALAIALTAGEKELLWQAHAAYARILAEQGAHPASIFFGKHAVNLIQEMRAEVAAIGRPVQRSFLAAREPAYRELADVLITTGRLPEAQEVLDMLKEEEYTDFLRSRTSESDFGRTRSSLTSSESRLAQELRASVAAATSITTPVDRVAPLRARLRKLASDAVATVRSNESAETPGLRLEPPAAGTTIVRYVVLRDRLRILGRHAGGSWRRDVAASPREINEQVFALREALQDPKREARTPAGAAYRLLFAPIAAELEAARTRRLELVLDGTLRYLPFGVLHDGRAYLVENYAIAVRTPAAPRRPAAASVPSRVAAFGVARGAEGFAPLPRVSAELEWIVQRGAGDRTGVMPGIVAMDEEFTAARLRQALAVGFPAVHLASHFVFRPGAVEDSFLLLGGGERLTLAALREKDYSLDGVSLLTLSACETAVGEPDASGREFESFSVLAQRQGAAHVLATLWPVADTSSAIFMARFYRDLRNGADPADALRHAQRTFVTVRGGQLPQKYRHPYYWAGYVASGGFPPAEHREVTRPDSP
jgi:CHAT domain-containing protein/Tfp pilus assembly protein PilF